MVNLRDNSTPLRKFLTAEWLHLAMLNYEVDPILLRSLLPAGTELDTFEKCHFVSLVAFLFQNTKVLNLSIPFHRNFEEVNLRFYVRSKGPEGWRRGVVFIKEVVPRWAIATVARVVYNEPYVSLPMHHELGLDSAGVLRDVHYSWGVPPRSLCKVGLTGLGDLYYPGEGSEESFITEHYWGYTRQRDGSTLEYRVEHPRWQVCTPQETSLEGELAQLYGEGFGATLTAKPRSVFLASGSDVTVYRGRHISSAVGPHS